MMTTLRRARSTSCAPSASPTRWSSSRFADLERDIDRGPRADVVAPDLEGMGAREVGLGPQSPGVDALVGPKDLVDVAHDALDVRPDAGIGLGVPLLLAAPAGRHDGHRAGRQYHRLDPSGRRLEHHGLRDAVV